MLDKRVDREKTIYIVLQKTKKNYIKNLFISIEKTIYFKRGENIRLFYKVKLKVESFFNNI